MIGWMPYYDEFQFITYELIWASMIYSVGGEILGDLVFILPLEGKYFPAQDQHTLFIHHKLRSVKHGIGYAAYHVHHFSPPFLHERKVEEYFQELPSWRVTHFAWLIAWGWRIHMRIFQTPCLKWRIFCSSSLLFLKRVLGGEDCNVPNFSIKYLKH